MGRRKKQDETPSEDRGQELARELDESWEKNQKEPDLYPNLRDLEDKNKGKRG
jgi:DNA-binding PadR family transcriptional regulator